MNAWYVAVVWAFWLGILTSISPCPLATNIAAVSYVGRWVDRPSSVLLSGLLYTAGRMLTYLVLGIILVSTSLSVPSVAFGLQRHMNRFLGPLLILVGLVLLDILKITTKSSGISRGIQRKAESMGIWGAGLLGIIFALSFCPTSAALFFGFLLPLAVSQQSGILLPAVYGVGTAVPVFLFALLLALGANRIARAFQCISAFEKWARRITGVLFIVIGVYFSITYLFGLNLG
ncbi:MAG TPA: sulfite exporter TauE/SafE family protein [Candidatus Aminicenantes bacterium]|nr:sulfite exporter TauE/SafE family protein [Candidatus Aminicenantes bacterium]